MLQENPSSSPIPRESAIRALLVLLVTERDERPAATTPTNESVIDRARAHMARNGA
jgi:hypothetical protein